MPIFALDDHAPQVAASAWVAPGATLLGRVVVDDDAGIWFGAVLRGDTEWIHVGPGTNVQDGAVLHADPGFPLAIGARVTVGHQAMLHGCTVGEGSLIGIGAIVLNGAVIGRECLVGAGALVTEGKVIAERSLVVGSPARVVRLLTDAERARLAAGAEHYIANARRMRAGLAEMPR